MPRYRDEKEQIQLRQKAVEYALQARTEVPLAASDLVKAADVIHAYLLDGTVPEASTS